MTFLTSKHVALNYIYIFIYIVSYVDCLYSDIIIIIIIIISSSSSSSSSSSINLLNWRSFKRSGL